jgi:hypothetical protein
VYSAKRNQVDCLALASDRVQNGILRELDFDLALHHNGNIPTACMPMGGYPATRLQNIDAQLYLFASMDHGTSGQNVLFIELKGPDIWDASYVRQSGITLLESGAAGWLASTVAIKQASLPH